MLWLPQSGRVKVITNGGIVGSATPWTAVASSGSTNTYGTVTECISAANNIQDSWGIEIVIYNAGAAATASEACCDILIGGATDDVLISSLICGGTHGAATARYFFPLHIPSGLRIAAQTSSVRSAAACRVGIWLYGGGVPPFRVGRKVTTYGTKTTNSRGVTIAPTASGGAHSITQMTASSTSDHFYFLPGFQAATDTTITPSGMVNIGIGTGASTEERIGTWWFGKSTDEAVGPMIPSFGAWQDVPSATRLTMLASNSGANDASYDGLIYAVS
jgi:hypothetical protein